MRRLLFVLVLLVAGVAALGYYRGWFTVSTVGKQEVDLKMDSEKLKEDEAKAKAKLEGLKGQIQDKADEPKKEAPAKPPRDGQN
jgi:beta-lactam-binding protein with PASTA domain